MTRLWLMARTVAVAAVTTFSALSAQTARVTEHSPQISPVGGGVRAAEVLDPAATRVSTPCEFGPGRMSVTLHPLATPREYRVEVQARGVADGEWLITVINARRELRRTAVDGRWSATTQARDFGRPQRREIEVDAETHAGACSIRVRPGDRTIGFGACASGKAGYHLAVQRGEDGSVVMRPSVGFDGATTVRWRFELTARGGGQTTQVTFGSYRSRNLEITGRVVLSDPPPDPRFTMRATNRADGTRCALRLNPGFTGPAPGPEGLRFTT